ncbi:MAG: efflux RND transporter periplasmic adaptor subunit [Planctomycetales bacterium]
MHVAKLHPFFLLALCLSGLLAGCSHSQGAFEPQQLPRAIVIVSRPVTQEVVDYVEYTGRTDAAESVEIRARVTGFLNKVLFVDGAEVEQGTPLYAIDDREYQAALDSARAEVASAVAHQAKANTDFSRVESLKQKGAVSAEEYDRADAAKKEADAAVQSAESKQERSQLDVDFSRIAAPIAGKISRSEITQGNLIKANLTLLTTIVSVDPMYVYFNVDEPTLLSLRRQVRDGQLESKRNGGIPVEMGLTIDNDYPHVGMIDFIENRVDPRTGTIRVRGKFDNPLPERGERVLDVGLFAQVRVPIGRPRESLLISPRAIGTDQGQKFVYVVDEQKEVSRRPIQIGKLHDGLRVVTSGLTTRDLVIIDGLQRVRPGVVVEAKPGDMRSRPGGEASPEIPAPDDSATADAP